MPSLMFLALPICVFILSMRNHRQATKRGEDLGVVGLAIRMWAYAAVLAPVVLVLSGIVYYVAIMYSLYFR